MTKLITLGILAGCTQAAFATIGAINIRNTDGVAALNLFVDSSNAGLTASNSSFYLGVMDESSIATSSSVSDLFSNFTLFDAVTTSGGDNPINPALDGFFLGEAQADFAPVDGLQIYLFAMNAANAAAADEALIWRFTGTLFDDDPNIGGTSPSAIQVIAANGTAIFGSDAVGNGNYVLSSVSAVPEPSSTALLGLGSVALLLRRRR